MLDGIMTCIAIQSSLFLRLIKHETFFPKANPQISNLTFYEDY